MLALHLMFCCWTSSATIWRVDRVKPTFQRLWRDTENTVVRKWVQHREKFYEPIQLHCLQVLLRTYFRNWISTTVASEQYHISTHILYQTSVNKCLRATLELIQVQFRVWYQTHRQNYVLSESAQFQFWFIMYIFHCVQVWWGGYAHVRGSWGQG